MAHSQIILNVSTSHRVLFHVNESPADINSPHVFGHIWLIKCPAMAKYIREP